MWPVFNEEGHLIGYEWPPDRKEQCDTLLELLELAPTELLQQAAAALPELLAHQ